jgi:hypothetical protein
MPSLWKHVKSEWFYTKRAAFFFVTSALIVVIVLAVSEFLPKAFGNPSTYSTVEEVAYTVVMMLWAISNLFVVVGMFRFWVACDKSRPITRKIWFTIMIVGLLRLGLGAAVYCFAVYLPQVTKRLTHKSESFGA